MYLIGWEGDKKYVKEGYSKEIFVRRIKVSMKMVKSREG